MDIFTAYSDKGKRGQTSGGGRSVTKQEFKDDCDINRLMRRYEKSGVPPAQVAGGVYGDFSSGLDFMEAQNKLLEAQVAFDSLSSRVRARFQNNPAALLDFLAEKKNRDEAIALGLIPAPVVKVEPPPQKVEIVNPPEVKTK